MAGAVLLLCAALAAWTFAAQTGESAGAMRHLLWDYRITFPGSGFLTGTAADLDGDGMDEIVVHSGRRMEPSHVAVLHAGAGRDTVCELWREAFPTRSVLVTWDSDADGAQEVVVACGTELVVLNGVSGERLGGAVLRGTIGDLACAQGRGRLRSVAATAGAATVGAAAGAADSEITAGAAASEGTASGAAPDAAGDGGAPALIYTAGQKRDDVLVVLDAGLNELWSREARSGSGPYARGFMFPRALDIDGDGQSEILVAENGNHLLCLAGDGELLWDIGLGRAERLNPEGVVSCAPIAADLLGDGALELAVGCYAGAVVLIDPLAGDVLDRVQFGADSHASYLKNEKIPRFIRNALMESGEPVNCLTAVELDGGAGLELVLGCSDGFLYTYDPGSGDIMWRFDTSGDVYDPCLQVDLADGRTHGILAWDDADVYFLDGTSGEPRPGLAGQEGADIAGAGSLLICRTGYEEARLVHVATRGGSVTAWTLGGSTPQLTDTMPLVAGTASPLADTTPPTPSPASGTP